MTKQDIIEGFLKNDKKVILYFYTKLFKQIKKNILNNGGDEDDVRNIIWKAFHAFKVQCQKKEVPPKNIEAYIVQVARFLWYKELTAKKKLQLFHQTAANHVKFVGSIESTLIETDRHEIALQFQQYLHNSDYAN